jgi:multidrug efflux pump subunit AcrB
VIVKGINGVEHVCSSTRDDSAVVTARFAVGTNADGAMLRVHDKLRANTDGFPWGYRNRWSSGAASTMWRSWR